MTLDQTREYSLEDLLQLMDHLRDSSWGCPWDKKQTFTSLIPSTIEEVYELVDALEATDNEQIAEELGDVLFQVVFYSQLGKENNAFSFHSVVDRLTKKLLRRHPHVFADGTLSSFANHQNLPTERAVDDSDIKQQWEAIKQQERQSKSLSKVLDDIPKAFPALTRSQKLQKRASAVGFDWDSVTEVLDKVDEEVTELKEALQQNNTAAIKEELGDLLFSIVNVCRFLSVDAESALRQSNTKFEKRFQYVEAQSQKHNITLDKTNRKVMNDFWDEAKAKKR